MWFFAFWWGETPGALSSERTSYISCCHLPVQATKKKVPTQTRGDPEEGKLCHTYSRKFQDLLSWDSLSTLRINPRNGGAIIQNLPPSPKMGGVAEILHVDFCRQLKEEQRRGTDGGGVGGGRRKRD